MVASRERLSFVFTDIEGSTSLARRMGTGWPPVLERHHEVLRAAIRDHGGTEVRTEGDAFVVTFEHPVDAVAFCVAAQLALAEVPWPAGGEVRVRMGAHVCTTNRLASGEHVGVDIHEAARIAATAHGGQIVVSKALAERVSGQLPTSAGLRDLGRHGLKDLRAPVALSQVTHPALRAAFPALRTLTANNHNLRLPPTRLVGREAAAHGIADLLTGDARLVSILGEGGLGKTRLALESAWDLLPWFRDGVWFVTLDRLREPAGIVPSIGRALGVDPGPGDALPQVLDALRDASVLIVLDNAEHLLDGIDVITDLLADCPDLRILVTSRQRLRLRGERSLLLDPLTLPDSEHTTDVAGASTALLLLERAADLGFPITIDDRTAPLLARVCRQLDGIPLAIELAAARLADLSLAELAARLDCAPDLLDEGDRDLPERQQSLRAALAWSEDLLSEDDRELFRCSCVFAGPFDVVAVAGVAGLDAAAAERGVSRLAAAGLLRRSSDRDSSRWHALVPIRQYGLDALERSGGLATVRERFVVVMTERVADLAPQLTTSSQRLALDRLAADHDNLHEAIARAEPSTAAALGAQLFRYWSLSGHWRQGLRALEELHAAGAGTSGDRVRVGVGVALLRWHLGLHHEASALLEQLERAEIRLLEPVTRAQLHNLHASVMLTRPDVDEAASLAGAQHHLEVASAAAEEAGDARITALVLHTRAGLEHERGDPSGAASLYLRLVVAWEQAGDAAAAADAAAMHATCLRQLGQFVEARRAGLDGLERARRSGNDRAATAALVGLAEVASTTGDPHGPTWAREASDLAEELGEPAIRAWAAHVANELAERADEDAARILFLGRLLDAADGIDEDVRSAWLDAARRELDELTRRGPRAGVSSSDVPRRR